MFYNFVADTRRQSLEFMGHKLAIDFGTTNSVIARWDEEDRLDEAERDRIRKKLKR